MENKDTHAISEIPDGTKALEINLENVPEEKRNEVKNTINTCIGFLEGYTSQKGPEQIKLN